jgi:hypothetical protein
MDYITDNPQFSKYLLGTTDKTVRPRETVIIHDKLFHAQN